jgi:hypothetical protein
VFEGQHPVDVFGTVSDHDTNKGRALRYQQAARVNIAAQLLYSW